MEDSRVNQLTEQTLDTKYRRIAPFVKDVWQLPCTRADVMGHLDRLQVAPTTKLVHFRQIRAFLRWAYLVHDVPLPKLQGILARVKEPDPDPLTEEEVQRLIASIDNHHDLVMIQTMLVSGLRAGELCSLRRSGVHDDYVEVVGKTGPQRYLIPKGFDDEFKGLGRDYLFYDKNGHQLTKDGVGARVRRQLRRAGIKKEKMGAHVLRHTFATMFFQRTGNLRLLQGVLGHSTLHMAMRYATLTPEHLQEKYQQQGNLFDLVRGGANGHD